MLIETKRGTNRVTTLNATSYVVPPNMASVVELSSTL